MVSSNGLAIARALVNHPQILLLDEPLGALDLKLRKNMQLELKNLQKKTGITFIYVTHDQEEAMTMSDTIIIMNRGRIQQIGSPVDIYNEPRNALCCRFYRRKQYSRFNYAQRLSGQASGCGVSLC